MVFIDSDSDEYDHPESVCLKDTEREVEWNPIGMLPDGSFGGLTVLHGPKEEVIKAYNGGEVDG